MTCGILLASFDGSIHTLSKDRYLNNSLFVTFYPISSWRFVLTMASRAVTWEVVVVITLFMSWVGCYFCRSHLFAVEPAFLEDSQLSSSQFGLMMAGGYAMYPTGKVLWGFVTDRFGGRVSLFSCILGTAAASAFFATGSSYGWYFVGWLLLRALQPAGWIGLVKLCGPWVPYQRQSRVLGFLSLSMMAGV